MFSGNALSEVFIKITVDSDEANQKMGDASKKASTFGDTFKAIMTSNIITKVFGLAIDGAKKAAQAFVGFIKSVVSSYAEYEQLVGGVETLFGAGGRTLEEYKEYLESAGKSTEDYAKHYRSLIKAQDLVMENAKKGWQTAGVDANTYMMQATSFSSSLIQSLNGDTKKAAEITDMAIIDMSDNMNKMGTPLESIQNAYQGFAKQNYTMLDNLKLGYGGTKTEMERLLADAQKLSGVKYDISNLSDVYEAIHVIQDNIGITGTTAKEAETTISGSVNQLKAAWENLKIAIGDPEADIGASVTNVVESAKTALGNLLPVISQAFEGIGELISQLAPILEKELPGLIEKLSPAISAMIEALIEIVKTTLVDLAPVILEGVKELITALWDAFKEDHETGAEVVKTVFVGTIGMGLINAIPEIISKLAEVLPELIESIAEFLTEGFEGLLETIGEGIEMIKSYVKGALDAIKSIVRAAWNAIKEHIIAPVREAATRVKTIFDNIKTAITAAVNAIKRVFETVKEALTKPFKAAWDIIKGIIDKLKNAFNFHWSLPSLKLPHISVKGGEAPFGIGGKGSLPKFSISWYKKAEENPYLFTDATLFGAGEAGDEMLYGRKALMDDIKEATSGGGVHITNYFTINNADRPEEVANTVVRHLKMQMRMA